MLLSELSWATFASLVLGVSCANDFVTSGSKSFPSQFGLDRKTTIYWGNRTGFIAGIYVYTNGQSDDSADYTWVLAPNCPGDSDDDCVAHDNSGSAPFYVNGTAVPLGSGYQLRLLWTTSKRYDDVDDDTEETASPSFSVVPAESIKGPSDVPKGLGPAEKAGIAIAVVVVVVFLLLVLWLRWRKEKRIKRRRTRQMRDVRDSKQGGWYERWTMGKRKDTDDSWTAANLPAKPSPAAAADVRKDSKTGSDGQLYIDDKAEMPTDAGNRHEVHAQGTSAARNKTELDGTSAPLGPAAVELPAEPVSGQNSALQSRTASTATSGTMFEYNPNPSYSLQAPASPHPDANTVSPVSEGVGTFNSMVGSVSPVTPIARKPVGGTIRAVPEQQHQQQQYKDPGRQITVMTDADDEAPRRGKSAILRKEKSRIWKMLGGGSTKGKLNPASGANA